MSEEAQDKPSAVRTYRCPSCNAEMVFEASSGRMSCNHCGHSLVVESEPGAVVEHDLHSGLGRSAPRGLGTAVRSATCKECGATVSFTESSTAKRCDFCGSSQILEQQENRNLMRPESVLPFQVDRTQASQKFTAWLRGLWFRPSNLKTLAKVTELSGVYVPYWTFDAQVSSSWTAEAGYYYYETETYEETNEKGETSTRTREVRHTRWERASGRRSDFHDDILVCASRGLPAELAAKLQTFKTAELRPYDPAFLAGWKAEEYSIDLDAAWTIAAQRMASEQEARCARDVPGDTHRSLSVSNHFSEQTFKHVLLPVWLSAYRYGEKVFRFLVNGQTGEVVGKAPWSAGKIALFVLALAAITTLIVILVKYFGGQ